MCVIVFITITVILIKANKKACTNLELDQRMNSGVPRYEEVEHQPSRISIAIRILPTANHQVSLFDSVTVVSIRTQSHDFRFESDMIDSRKLYTVVGLSVIIENNIFINYYGDRQLRYYTRR